MSKLRVLSKLGDTTTKWDKRAADTGDTEAQEAIREAERIFREERSRGATAFRVNSGTQATKIDEFDPEAEQIVMVPRVAGG